MKDLYEVVFKRKSIRKFDETLVLTAEELEEIKQIAEKLIPFVADIKVEFEIVERASTTAKYGEHCLLMFSEKKPHYLLNAGYMMEQMDLFLTANNIGVCWYALAKTEKIQADGLDYIIMLAFGKSRKQDFRKDVSEFKRKNKEEIWVGDFYPDVIEAVRLAPSACNTQPWRIFSDMNSIKVCRMTKIKSFIPASKLPFYNSIDMGICLCFLEIAMIHKGVEFGRELILEKELDSELIEIARYNVKYTAI